MNKNKASGQLKELKKYKGKLRLAAEGWNSEFKTLIATLLSARTRDEKTIAVSKELFKKYPNAHSLAKAKLGNIQKIIRPINFYKTKSKNVVNCAKALAEKYNGRVPKKFEELIKLPGVGRKTANVFLAVYGHPKIGVDTHVSQISMKLGWTKNKNPKKIENDLEKLFPKSKWRSINYILVGVGRSYRGKKQNELLNKIKKI